MWQNTRKNSVETNPSNVGTTNAGYIVGVASVGLLGAVVIGTALVYTLKKRRNPSGSKQDNADHKPDNVQIQSIHASPVAGISNEGYSPA